MDPDAAWKHLGIRGISEQRTSGRIQSMKSEHDYAPCCVNPGPRNWRFLSWNCQADYCLSS